FSSRRRHTRFSRDWSSDVCSSDLMSVAILVLAQDLAGAGVDVHVPLAAIPVDDLDLVDVAQKATVELEVRDLAAEFLFELLDDEIGRASCREREWVSAVAGSV